MGVANGISRVVELLHSALQCAATEDKLPALSARTLTGMRTNDEGPNPVSLRHDLRGFTGAGYDRGRNILWQVAWLLISGLVVVHWWCPARLRLHILRLFGASIGNGVLIRHRVRIHWPWKLTVGDGSWVGEEVWILNLEPVTIGENVCVSQGVLLCTGSHQRDSRTFEFDNAPIVIDDGAWIAARATVLRGVHIGADCVVGATALVTSSIAAGTTMLAPRAERSGGARSAAPSPGTGFIAPAESSE